MPDPTKTQEAPAVEIVTGENTTLQPVRSNTLEEAPALGALAFQADAVAIVERLGETLQTLQAAMIRVTLPEDWIIQGNGLGLLTNAGANRCAPLLGLYCEDDLTPVKSVGEDGEILYTVSGYVYSNTLRRGEHIEFTRSSIEPFLGRQVKDGQIVNKGGKPHDPDHRSAARSGFTSKAVRKLGMLGNVPEARLLEIFGPGAKGRFQRGHGGGSARDRVSEAVAEGDVRPKAKELGDEILRRVNGDTTAARDLLRELTVNKEGKYGKDSVSQFTKPEQVVWAWERLQKHPVFGDKAVRREPGQDEGTEP